MKITPLNLWAPVSPTGLIVHTCTDYTRREAIARILDEWNRAYDEWADMRRIGWTVIKVQIAPR